MFFFICNTYLFSGELECLEKFDRKLIVRASPKKTCKRGHPKGERKKFLDSFLKNSKGKDIKTAVLDAINETARNEFDALGPVTSTTNTESIEKPKRKYTKRMKVIQDPPVPNSIAGENRPVVTGSNPNIVNHQHQLPAQVQHMQQQQQQRPPLSHQISSLSGGDHHKIPGSNPNVINTQYYVPPQQPAQYHIPAPSKPSMIQERHTYESRFTQPSYAVTNPRPTALPSMSSFFNQNVPSSNPTFVKVDAPTPPTPPNSQEEDLNALLQEGLNRYVK